MSKRKYRVNDRKWLNPDSNTWTGYIVTQVQDTSLARAPHTYPKTFFKLADCEDTISLSFSMWKESDRAQSLEKARILRDALIEFTEALEREDEVINKRRAGIRRK